MELPAQFIEKVNQVFGYKGREWLPGLPAIAAQCRNQWALPEGVPCQTMSMNYIEFTTTSAGVPVALKIGVPHGDLFTEMEALKLYNGSGIARLIEADRELGALLIQRFLPGTMLYELGDNREETKIAASVMRRLPVPVPEIHSLPQFSDWTEDAFRLARTELDLEERMPRDLIARAEAALEEIERVSSDRVVLHGDLHHENILFDAQAGWMAIDPKGVIGPRCLEVGRFLQNQLPTEMTIEEREERVRERIAIFSEELGYAPRLLAASGLVDCVLSHCWSLEDEGDLGPGWYQGVELARFFCRIAGC